MSFRHGLLHGTKASHESAGSNCRVAPHGLVESNNVSLKNPIHSASFNPRKLSDPVHLQVDDGLGHLDIGILLVVRDPVTMHQVRAIASQVSIAFWDHDDGAAIPR